MAVDVMRGKVRRVSILLKAVKRIVCLLMLEVLLGVI